MIFWAGHLMVKSRGERSDGEFRRAFQSVSERFRAQESRPRALFQEFSSRSSAAAAAASSGEGPSEGSGWGILVADCGWYSEGTPGDGTPMVTAAALRK